MIAEDISKGKENVKVPVVNELNEEKPSEFGYTPFCIGGPNVSEAFNSPFYTGCRCQQLSCTMDICSCLERYGPFYDEDGCLQIYNQPTGMQSLIKEVLTTPSDLEFVLHLSHEWI